MGDIDFEVISAAENSNKFQKARFWKEKSVEEVVTLGPSTKNLANTCQQKSLDSSCAKYLSEKCYNQYLDEMFFIVNQDHFILHFESNL
jgi:hypothetical protein